MIVQLPTTVPELQLGGSPVQLSQQRAIVQRELARAVRHLERQLQVLETNVLFKIYAVFS